MFTRHGLLDARTVVSCGVMFRDFGEFMKAVGWWWLGVLGTSLVGLVWSVSQQNDSRALMSPRFWGLPLIAFVIGCFGAWRQERDERISAQERMVKEEPDFSGYINRMAFEDPVDGICLAYLLVSVENIGGRPSILHNWRMYVQPPNKLEQEVPVSQPKDGEDCHLVTEATGNEVVIGYDEFISVKAYPNGVKPGDGRRGFMRAELPVGLPEGTRFVLTFKDAHKKRTYSCEYDTADRKDRANDVSAIGSWPGVKIRHGRITVANR